MYSATDLNNDLACRHLSALERRVVAGELDRPEPDPSAKLIATKGEEHELRYLEAMRSRYGAGLVEFPGRLGSSLSAVHEAEAETRAAMASGAPMIYQGTFFDGTFLGRADFLRRVDAPCAAWPWSYEVLDTKLALDVKPYFLLQLCNYSEHVERIAGAPPKFGYIVTGTSEERRFRIDDYAAYYRRQKRRFLNDVASPGGTYPYECAHCAICRWFEVCDRRRDDDDFLGLVATMRSDQIEKFAAAGITTIAQLAAASDGDRPRGMMEETFARLRAQAALQHRQRRAFAAGVPGTQRYFYELLEHEPAAGLEAMPEPDAGDAFFDMEGDPLYAPARGLEYLFGVYLPLEGVYRAFWARTDRDERAAYEALVDFLAERRATYPLMHVYHYAAYEKSALRHLSGRYDSRQEVIDDWLRAHVLIDLYEIVRRSLRISQPSYSIKKLEPFYGMTRAADVRRGDDSIVMFEAWRTSGDETILTDIERYNEEDCRSTYLLRQWLLERRTEVAERIGRPLAWKQAPVDVVSGREEAGSDAAAVTERAIALSRRLIAGRREPLSGDELLAMSADDRMHWILGSLLEYHRRESKPGFWQYFERCENVDLLVEFDRDAIGGLTLCEDVPPYKHAPRDRNLVYTYAFPAQEHHLGTSEPLRAPQGKNAGTIVAVDDAAGRLKIKLSGTTVPSELRALIPATPLPNTKQRQAVIRVAEAFLDGTLAQTYPVVSDLLLGRPRLLGRRAGDRIQPPDASAEAMSAIVHSLDASYLFVQGPPGSGKTTKIASVIVDLLAARKRVGVMALSHKANHHLLRKVETVAARRGVRFDGAYKASNANAGSTYESSTASPIANVFKGDARAFLTVNLVGGTSYLYAQEYLADTLDYLFIDEAGQIALADAIACAQTARNVVLVGDPLQLPQVSQGSHPFGADASVLEHLLGGRHTIPPDCGMFLDVSYRMHPDLCTFVSRTIYDGRLRSDSSTHANRVDAPRLRGSGLRYIAVGHDGNSIKSPEEADRIVDEIGALLRGEVTVRGTTRAMTQDDILVVTPYNAQRALIERKLAEAGFDRVRAGTVDKFQGQEAPVVFYSMAASSDRDISRDIGFLFDRNRFNVAISRAECMTVLVASPRLLDVACSTPEQLALVNLACAFVESARSPDVVAGGTAR